MKLLFTFIFSISIMFSVTAQVVFTKGSWEAILEKAKKEDKHIYVFGYKEDCIPCTRMMGNVLTNNTKVAEFYNENFINVRLDLEKSYDGKLFARRYDFVELPTSFFFNPEGGLVHQYLGSLWPSDFLELGSDALNPDTQLVTLSRKFELGIADDSEKLKYAEALLENGDPKCDEVLSAFMEGKDETTRENMRVIFKFSYPSLSSYYFSKVLYYYNEYIDVIEEDELNTKIFQASYKDALKKNIDPNNLSAVKGHMDLYFNRRVTDDDPTKVYLDQMMFAKNQKDRQIFLLEAKKLLKDLPDHPWDFYNDCAYSVFRFTDDPEYLALAMRWVNYSISQEMNYFNLDTKAWLLYKIGRKEEAMKYLLMAIDDGEGRGYQNYMQDSYKLLKILKNN